MKIKIEPRPIYLTPTLETKSKPGLIFRFVDSQAGVWLCVKGNNSGTLNYVDLHSGLLFGKESFGQTAEIEVLDASLVLTPVLPY